MLAKPFRSQLINKGVKSIWVRTLERICIDAELNIGQDRELRETYLTWTTCHPSISGSAFYNYWNDRIIMKQINDNWWL